MQYSYSKIDFLIGDTYYEIDFEYQPFEQQTMTYPGCPASVELESIYVEGELQDVCDIEEDIIEILEIEALKHAQE